MTSTLEVEAPSEACGELALVDLHDLMQRDPPSARYVFEPIIPRRVTTLLGGHGGMGKSVLALILAAHAACGRQWGSFAAVQCHALYVSLEDDADTVRYRLRRIIEVYNLPAANVLDALQVLDGSDVDATLAMEVAFEGIHRVAQTAAMERVANVCKGAGLIVIDNASDAYGGNENDRRQVRTFIRALTQLARATDAGVLLLAHIDKSAARNGANGNSYSGSTAWHNSVRSRLALLSEESGISLTHEKAQFSKTAEAMRLAFVDHGVLVPVDAQASQRAADSQIAADADSVAAALAKLVAEGMNVPTAATGGYTAWHVLATVPEIAALGKDRTKHALVNLERSGRVVRVEYCANRKSREGFALAQNATVEGAPISAPIYPPIPPSCIGARGAHAPIMADSIGAASAQIGALAQPSDWLANADPDIKRRVKALRANGSSHD
ncbi:MAG: hypothetical protein OJF61_001947 [Rhodanobacteraceae bacterium]|jgi:hypothetical protein|nr:MAG: hypothetical protein OJF61_001947 [Rhodanobacteraceae bacterium]